jgi:general secretion pathway protein H
MKLPEHRGGPFQGKGSGFTLLELLIVMVIVGFMAALVVPAIGHSLDNLRLRTVTREVSASLRYTRSRAVSEKMTYCALFDPEKKMLTISGEKNPAPSKDTSEEQEKVGREVYIFPKHIIVKLVSHEEDAVEPVPFAIRFFPNGSSSGGEFLLMNARERRYRIFVDFITGLVRVDQPSSHA